MEHNNEVKESSGDNIYLQNSLYIFNIYIYILLAIMELFLFALISKEEEKVAYTNEIT